MRVLLKLQIKPEHNPPCIGKSTEPGLIATQEIIIPDDVLQSYGEVIFASTIINKSDDLIHQFIEVVKEEIKEDN
jgi:hypothetical protein